MNGTQNIHNSFSRRGKIMNILDYDRALYYTQRSQWDNLLILMVRTKDDFLSKKIEHFLHAYNFSKDYSVIEKHLYALLRYIDHALDINGHDISVYG
jgi:YhdB-like protein